MLVEKNSFLDFMFRISAPVEIMIVFYSTVLHCRSGCMVCVADLS